MRSPEPWLSLCLVRRLNVRIIQNSPSSRCHCRAHIGGNRCFSRYRILQPHRRSRQIISEFLFPPISSWDLVILFLAPSRCRLCPGLGRRVRFWAGAAALDLPIRARLRRYGVRFFPCRCLCWHRSACSRGALHDHRNYSVAPEGLTSDAANRWPLCGKVEG